MSRVIGSPEKLAEAVVEEARRSIEAKVREAFEAARRIVERAYEEAREAAVKRLEEEARQLEERLAALEAAKTVELRKEIAQLKSRIVEDVVREGFERFRERLPGEKYEALLRRLLEEAARNIAKHAAEAIVVPVARDRELLTRLVEEARVEGVELKMASIDAEGLGGFLVQSIDGTVRLDYRLETVFSTAIEEARAAALKALFEESRG